MSRKLPVWRTKQPPRYKVLEYLAKHGSATQKEIAANNKLRVRDSTRFLESTLPKLVKAGLLEKVDKFTYRITDKGRMAAQKHSSAGYRRRQKIIEQVEELAGELPPNEITERVNGTSSQRRIDHILRRRVKVYCRVQNSSFGLTAPELIKILNRNQATIYGLRKLGLKICTNQKTWFIYYDDLRDWARRSKRNQYIFWGCDANELEVLLGDRDWAEELSRLPRVAIPSRAVAVCHVASGEIYPSYREAGRHHHVSASALRSGIARARAANTNRFASCHIEWDRVE